MTFLGIWSAASEINRRRLRSLSETIPGVTVTALHDDGRLAFCRLVQPSGCEANVRAGALIDAPGMSATSVVGQWRLDRRRELAKALGAPENGAVLLSDEELLRQAYEKYGEECAQNLWGEFAFAVWDRANRRIFMARDPVGAIPLYYTLFREGLAFAPDIRVLLALPGISRRPNPRTVLDCLGEFPEAEESTAFADIRRLPPAHCLVALSSGLKVRQYYQLDAGRELTLPSDADYAAELHSALERAVRARMPTDSSCAVMLSGGLDSSFVAGLAATCARKAALPEVASVSAVFDEFPRSDERGYQRAVVRSAGTRHTEIRPHARGASGDWRQAEAVFLQPSFIGPHWLAWAVAQAVAGAKHSVVLTGIDGDRVVWHGLGRLAELANAGQWQHLAREIFALPNRTPVTAGLRFMGHAARGLFPRFVGQWVDTLRRPGLVNHRLALRMLRKDRLVEHSVRERLCVQPRPRSAREAHWQALTAPDRAKDVELLYALGSAYGIQFRHPFFDREVVELCLSLPGAQKLRDGHSRFVLRRAMAGTAPESVSERREKAYLDEPYAAWLRSALRRATRDGSVDFDNLADYVEPPALRGLLADVLAGRDVPVDFVWRCTITSLWLELQERAPVRPGAI